MSDEELARRAGKNGATIYAGLMDYAVKDSEVELLTWLGDRANGLVGNLTTELCGHLRRAYTAGVADGYRQAVIEREEGS